MVSQESNISDALSSDDIQKVGRIALDLAKKAIVDIEDVDERDDVLSKIIYIELKLRDFENAELSLESITDSIKRAVFLAILRNTQGRENETREAFNSATQTLIKMIKQSDYSLESTIKEVVEAQASLGYWSNAIATVKAIKDLKDSMRKKSISSWMLALVGRTPEKADHIGEWADEAFFTLVETALPEYLWEQAAIASELIDSAIYRDKANQMITLSRIETYISQNKDDKVQELIENIKDDVLFREIAIFQAQSGDIVGAKKTVSHIKESNQRDLAYPFISEAEASAGSILDALETSKEIKRDYLLARCLCWIAAHIAEKGDRKKTSEAFASAAKIALASDLEGIDVLCEITASLAAHSLKDEARGNVIITKTALTELSKKYEKFGMFGVNDIIKRYYDIAKTQREAGFEKDAQKSFAEIEQIISHYGFMYWGRDGIAILQAKAGDLKRAIENMKQVKDESVSSVRACTIIIEALLKAKDLDGARKIMKMFEAWVHPDLYIKASEEHFRLDAVDDLKILAHSLHNAYHKALVYATIARTSFEQIDMNTNQS
jgi:hypothetical protein